MKFQPKTRGEYDYEILKMDRGGLFPIIAIIFDGVEGGSLATLSADGRWNGPEGHEHAYDLLPAPQEVWVNIYEGEECYIYTTKEGAINGQRRSDIIARKRLTYNPGEFDE